MILIGMDFAPPHQSSSASSTLDADFAELEDILSMIETIQIVSIACIIIDPLVYEFNALERKQDLYGGRKYLSIMLYKFIRRRATFHI